MSETTSLWNLYCRIEPVLSQKSGSVAVCKIIGTLPSYY
jgi:hypothetical protein